jgi:alpha-L-arabinofuranosidase
MSNSSGPLQSRRHPIALNLGRGLILVAALWPVSAKAIITADVQVNAASVRATMSPLGLGLHTSPYYNNMSSASADDRLEEAGVTTLRFGGGGYADINHWSITRSGNGITGSGLSPWWGEPSNFGYVGAGSDFASFVRLVDQVDGGRAVVTVNDGSAMKLVGGQSAVPDFGGQPKEAAAWVAYANADPSIYGMPDDIAIGIDQQGNDWKTAGYWARLRASSAAEYQTWAAADGVFNPLNSFLAINRDAPVGIKYWEIGNETFGTGYYGGGNGYSVDYDVPYGGNNRDDHAELSPANYGQEVVEYSQLMKSIDPTIKIGAVLATPPDDYSWSYADLNDNNAKNANEPYWNDEVLAQAAADIDFVMVHWYPQAGNNANGNSLLSQVRTKLPLMIEGATPGQDAGTSAGIRDLLAAHGIPDAEIMVTEFNYFGSLQTSVANAAESIFVADAYATWLEQGVTSVQYLEMLTKDFLSDSGGLMRGSAFYGISMIDKLIEPGESFVTASSSHNNVRVHAAVQVDGSVAIMVLNLDLTNTADVTINVDGVSLGSSGTKHLLTGGTSLTSTPATDLGSTFAVSLPTRSIATFVIPAMATLAGDFNNDGVVDASDYVVWRDGLGTVYTHDQYETWRANFGRAITASAAGGDAAQFAQVPEPASWLLLFAAAVVGSSARRTFQGPEGTSVVY